MSRLLPRPTETPFPKITFPLRRWLAIALLSGIVMGLAPDPRNFWVLAWVALAPLWAAVVELTTIPASASRGLWHRFRGFSLGFAWGVGYHSIAIFWITGIHPMTWMGVPWLASLAIALFCWVAIMFLGGVLVGTWSAALGWVLAIAIRKHSTALKEGVAWTGQWVGLRLLLGVTLWCIVELVWSKGALFWTALGYTQSSTNLWILHLGQLSGPATVAGAIVLVNGLLAEAWLQWRNQRSALARSLVVSSAIALVTLHLIGFGLYNRPLKDAPNAALHVGIIQGNVPNTIKLYEDGLQRSLQNYTKGYRQLAAAGVDAVLTPETALPILWTSPYHTRNIFYQAILEEGVPVWLGAFGGEGNRISNSLFMVSGAGETLSEYRKAKLVPLGEYIPFEEWLGGLINRLSPLEARLVRGDFDQQFQTPFGQAIAAICYESAFSDLFRDQAHWGGKFILTASNNAHYSAAMPAQHHAQDVMRAIETDRWAVRATNTGFSGIVDPHGNTLWLSGWNTYEIHDHIIYRRQTQTPYVRFGDWLTPLLGAIALLALGKVILNQ